MYFLYWKPDTEPFLSKINNSHESTTIEYPHKNGIINFEIDLEFIF